MRLYDIDGIRLCPPIPGLPLPPLFFGENNDFKLEAVNTPFPVFCFNQVVKAPGFIQTSSQRWKTNVATIESPLEKIQALRGVSFNWDKAHGGTASIGLIAEEVAKVIPELVATEADGRTASGVNYGNLVALLIEGVKQQQQQINAKDVLVRELDAKVNELQDELQQLREQLNTIASMFPSQQE
jgi:hypothetical protein